MKYIRFSIFDMKLLKNYNLLLSEQYLEHGTFDSSYGRLVNTRLSSSRVRIENVQLIDLTLEQAEEIEELYEEVPEALQGIWDREFNSTAIMILPSVAPYI